eukprot:UN12725
MAELNQPDDKSDESTDDIKIEHEEKKNDGKIVLNIGNKESIKILFLDIDGVMNGAEDLFGDDIYEQHELFKAHRINRLKHILDKTNCKVVLSSAWRRHIEGKHQIKRAFTKKGIKWDTVYIGDTPIEDNFYCQDWTQRTYEIDKYLKSIQATYVVEAWCAVDDMLLDRGVMDKQIMTGHFVATDAYVGLTDEDTLKIINILNK